MRDKECVKNEIRLANQVSGDYKCSESCVYTYSTLLQ